ncbi:MAG TPA: GNAT family N-acetyltransferase [Actinomycetota bacterium]|nr:GNAT family N-acetyltransferase [Actinomycetota bacterium]
MDERGLIDAANRNYAGSYRKLVEHVDGAALRETEGIMAFVTGAPLPLFNGCLVTAPVTPAELDAALAWLDAYDVPSSLWIQEGFERDLEPGVLERGFVRETWAEPAMVLDPPVAVPAAPPGIAVTAVDAPGLEAFLGIGAEGGRPSQAALDLFPPTLVDDPEVRLFAVALHGEPVGTSIAVRTGDVAGIYGVGTSEAARRRGVGTAATWAAVRAGLEWGCGTIVLQSSEMGFPVYDAMGFRTLLRYVTYVPAAEGR